MGSLFADRADAGFELARALEAFRGRDVVVLGLPRGGVPVAYEVARALGAPLDVCVVRKIGAPIQPELAIGAVAEEGCVHVDDRTARLVGVSETELAELVALKRREVEERVRRFRGRESAVEVRGKTALVVDDGIATGSTAHAALLSLRQRGAKRVVLAVPVGASESLEKLSAVADEIVCPHPRRDFWAVGLWYQDFRPTTDSEVATLLRRARAERASAPPPEVRQ